MSAQGAALALQIVGNFAAREARKTQIAAQNTIDEANAYAANLGRDSSNRVSAAVTGLSNFARSLNSKRAGAAAGAKLNAMRTNMARIMDRVVKGDIHESLQAAEQMGQVSVAASAMGVGGGSTDMVKRMLTTRRAIQKDQMEQAVKMQKADFMDAQRAGISELYGALDVTTSLASYDYGVTQPAIRGKGSSFLSILTGVDPSLLVNTFYKTPTQAGSMAGRGSVQGNPDYPLDI